MFKKINLRVFSLCLILLLASLLVSCGEALSPPLPELKERDRASFETASEATDFVRLDFAMHGGVDVGYMVIELFPSVAPDTVAFFKERVTAGDYDGLSIERMIKKGYLETNELDKTYTLKGEYADNGYQNPLKHTKGVVSLVRTLTDFDQTAGDFRIVAETYPSFDEAYAGFGYVTYNMALFEGIMDSRLEDNNHPVSEIVLTKASFASLVEEGEKLKD